MYKIIIIIIMEYYKMDTIGNIRHIRVSKHLDIFLLGCRRYPSSSSFAINRFASICARENLIAALCSTRKSDVYVEQSSGIHKSSIIYHPGTIVEP